MLSNSGLIAARPAAPVAPYLGGKRNLARRIIERLQTIPHQCYAEPFVGMGGVFLRRPFRARAEVINDRSRDVATLFRVLQRHYTPFLDMLRWQLTSRADFEALAEALAGLKGRFLLSLNDTPGVRECFQAFAIEAVETTYSIAGGAGAGRGKVGEVLITPPRGAESALRGL